MSLLELDSFELLDCEQKERYAQRVSPTLRVQHAIQTFDRPRGGMLMLVLTLDLLGALPDLSDAFIRCA